VTAAIVQWCKIIERFEFEGFFDWQSDQNATTTFVDAISLRKFVDREAHSDAQSTTKKVGPLDASNPNGPYRVIEILAGDFGSVGQLCATIDDNAAT